MILIKDLNTGKNFNFEITKFPDGTSQCWQLSPPPEPMSKIEVIWLFENEAELFHVCQIGDLLSVKFKSFPTLNCPWLPYSRQDKPTGNNSTFARNTFINLVYESGYSNIKTFDGHSFSDMISSQYPTGFHESIKGIHDVYVFPDAGALRRYTHFYENEVVICDKKRNQITGEIEGLVIHSSDSLEGRNVVIVDDICDGGRTFIEVAKVLAPLNPASIDLCVSHGIFSKGLDVLFDAGIRNIYTTNSRMNMIHTKGFETLGHNLTVFDIIDLGSNLDYNDLKRQERKLV